jgi:cell division protein FtsW
VVGLLPTKGLPLPFVSFGGSSLLVAMAGVGLLLNISMHGDASGAVRPAVRRMAEATS